MRLSTLAGFFLLWILGLSSDVFGLDILSPPGTWGDPCQQEAFLALTPKPNDPEILFQKGLKALGPMGAPQGVPDESCTKPNPHEGRTFLKKAAEAGHPHAASMLGMIYDLTP